MGARGSKTKPSATKPLSRRGTFQTLIVAMDSKNEYVDEVATADDAKSSEGDVVAASNGSPVKVSKVQEILEGRIELRKSQQLEHLVARATPSLELQFSSSEDSDDGGNKKKRKGTKRRSKKQKNSGDSKTATPAPTPKPSPVKLNEVKAPKRSLPIQKQPETTKEYFEEIKDAYALSEYTVKDTDEPQAKAQSQQTQQASPLKSKQQPSPGASPSKFFGSTFENWRNPVPISSGRSNRSFIKEVRDASRRSPPKSVSNRPSPSAKSNDSRYADHPSGRWASSKLDHTGSSESFGRSSTGSFDYFAVPAERSPAANAKVVEERHATAPTPKRPMSDRRNLRIDDTDESIMDDILAEVIT